MIDGQGEAVSRQRVKVEDAACVAGSNNGCVVGVVLEGEICAGDNGTGGVGDNALHGGAVLGMRETRREQRDEDHQGRER